ncbi:MAG: SCO family protein [Magnetospirillum sp.]|nr:SCO family protein [Magnetospirillum sp.]
MTGGRMVMAVFAAVLAGFGFTMAPRAGYGQDVAAPAALSGRFLLTDQDGRRVDQDSYRGKVRVMSFGYTYCPDVCPTTLATIAAAMDKLGADADQVVPIFVSVDPKRDSPSHLKEYLAAFDKRLVGLTGTDGEVAAAARNFHVRYTVNAPEGTADNYTVDHTAGVFIMDRDGRFLAKLGHLVTADDLAARILGYLK